MPDVSLATATERSRLIAGAGATLLSALCFATKGVIVKCAYPYGVDAATLLALRMAFALPVFAVIAWRCERAAAPLSPRRYLAIASLAIVGYFVASLLDFYGLAYITAGTERMVLFLYPTMVVLLAVLVMHQRLTGKVVAALLATYAGVAMTCWGQVDGSDHLIRGVALVAGSAFAYAVFIVWSGPAMRGIAPHRFMALAMSAAGLAVLLHFGITHPLSAFVQPAPVYAYALMLAVISTIVPSLLMSEGLKRIGAQRFAVLSTVSPVATVILAWLVLDERPGALAAVGMVLTIVASLAMGMAKPKG